MQPCESTAEKNTRADKLTLYMIGHDPDAHYLPALFEQLEPIVKRINFVVTDNEKGCVTALRESGILYNITHYVPQARDKFDFSLARNRALSMCPLNEWCMWLDCDDWIENPERILEGIAKANDDITGFLIPYNVSDSQSNIVKLRIHKRGAWKWKNRIHEELVPVEKDAKPPLAMLHGTEVIHRPKKGKSNHKWHISLLKDSVKNTPNDFAYLMKEHLNIGEWEACLDWARKTFAVHPINVERFNAKLFEGISLANLDREEEAIAAFHGAIEVRPWRREPYFFLAEIMGEKGDDYLHNGLGYISACNALIDLREPGQNGLIYELLGYKLHARFLQKFGYYEAAHGVMMKAKRLDDEAKDIIKEIEEAMKEKATKERNENPN